VEFNPGLNVTQEELLARHILYSSHIRADASVKPDPFIPEFDSVRLRLELSVTRHDNLSEGELWDRGRQVAGKNAKELQGRADVSAAVYISKALSISPDPERENPQHVVIINWPEKPAQKALALEISENSTFKTEHVIDCKDASNYIDRVVIASGRVSEIRKDAKQNVSLLLEPRSPPSLIVRIRRDVMAASSSKLSNLEGRTISVLGKVLASGNIPEIEVSSEAQIQAT
jgi:hypothetical protein